MFSKGSVWLPGEFNVMKGPDHIVQEAGNRNIQVLLCCAVNLLGVPGQLALCIFFYQKAVIFETSAHS